MRNKNNTYNSHKSLCLDPQVNSLNILSNAVGVKLQAVRLLGSEVRRHSSFTPQLQVKLSPKYNRGFFCECTQVKPSSKSIITTKEALLRFTVFPCSGQTHFQWECYGHFYDSIKISIFKTVRSLDTTWSFAGSITRVSTHEHQHWQHCLCTQSQK